MLGNTEPMLTDTTPRIDGERIRLRPFEAKDTALVASVADDPLIPLITSVPSDPTPEAIEAYLIRQEQRPVQGWGYSLAVANLETDEAVGQLSLALRNLDLGRASVGYWIAPQHRRRGYAAAALDTIAEWAFGFEQLRRLELYVEPWNEGSWRTAEVCGFHREGLMREWERVGDQWRDMYMYSRLVQ